MLAVGSHAAYEWLVTDENFDLLQICPAVVLGKYVAVTSIDSGECVLTADERAAGWQNREKIAYSPKIQRAEDLPREGWDEWYIFNSATELGVSHLQENIFQAQRGRGHVNVFVNYGLALHKPGMESFTSLFWQQMEWVLPESYVADSDYLNFVSMNKALFVSVHDAIKVLGMR